MLRPLKVFETDKDGALVLDRHGEPIPLPNPVPKRLEEYAPSERENWERQLADDREWRIRADRRRLQDDIVLAAARLVAADASAKKK